MLALYNFQECEEIKVFLETEWKQAKCKRFFKEHSVKT